MFTNGKQKCTFLFCEKYWHEFHVVQVEFLYKKTEELTLWSFIPIIFVKWCGTICVNCSLIY